MRLLVVEDDVRMAGLLSRGLKEDGYAVDVVGDGQDAVWMAQEHPYSVIVLDCMLPGLDGFEVCRRLRGTGCWAAIIMLTARTAVADRIEGLDAGADDYLSKPFSFAELAARVRAVVRRSRQERPTVLAVGDLRLDPARRRAWRGDTELCLSAKEFALLELFMRHPGVVLERARILAQVWDFAFDPASNVVDQYVAYLRRKLDRPFGRSDLETIRGAGYRLRGSAPTDHAGPPDGADPQHRAGDRGYPVGGQPDRGRQELKGPPPGGRPEIGRRPATAGRSMPGAHPNMIARAAPRSRPAGGPGVLGQPGVERPMPGGRAAMDRPASNTRSVVGGQAPGIRPVVGRPPNSRPGVSGQPPSPRPPASGSAPADRAERGEAARPGNPAGPARGSETG